MKHIDLNDEYSILEPLYPVIEKCCLTLQERPRVKKYLESANSLKEMIINRGGVVNRIADNMYRANVFSME